MTLGGNSRLWGWISGAWQKQPIIFGFIDTTAEEIAHVDAPAGNSTKDGTAVPAGEVWVVTSATMRSDSASATEIVCSANIDLTSYFLFTQRSPTAWVWYDAQPYWVLGPGDYMQVGLNGATLNDDYWLQYIGFKFDIDQ